MSRCRSTVPTVPTVRPQGPAGADGTGVQGSAVIQSGPVTPGTTDTLTCNAKKVAIGGGAIVVGGSMTGSYPSRSGQNWSWTVTATAGSTSVQMFVVCA